MRLNRMALTLSGGGATYNPSTLFAAGEQGAWYDPSDLSSMFQGTDTSTPAVVDAVVGRINDKSGRGNHATQATSASKPILRQDAGGKYYLDFDGLDDCLFNSGINFTAGDKMTVWYAMRPGSTALSIIVELSANAPSANGAFYSAANENAAGKISLGARPTVAADAIFTTSTSFGNGVTSVVTGTVDLSQALATNKLALRVNGAAQGVTSNNGADVAGNFGNHALFIGRRNNASLPFTGRNYGLIVRALQSSATDISGTEVYLGGKSGVTI